MTPPAGLVVRIYSSGLLDTHNTALVFVPLEAVGTVGHQVEDMVYIQTLLLSTEVRRAAREPEEVP